MLSLSHAVLESLACQMLKPTMRRDAVKWLTEEYTSKFKDKAVTTAPTAESSQVPDWMVSRMHRGSAALQRAILVSARVVAAGCDRVGAGVSAVMPERRLPQLPWEEAERMQQGFEAVRRTPYVASSEWCRGARLHAPLHPSPSPRPEPPPHPEPQVEPRPV